MPDPDQVRSMFGRIAPTYDLLNRGLTLGTDQRWRKRLVRRSQELGEDAAGPALDVCCGSGDVALLLARAGADVVGVDFTPELLDRAERKASRASAGERRPLFCHGDALALPFADASVARVTIAFGLRNLADRLEGLAEFQRVLRPGAWLLVLELAVPRGPLSGVSRLYFERMLPAIGRAVSRDEGAYGYLRDTVVAWPAPEQLARELTDVGYDQVGFERLLPGLATLHWARRPPEPGGSSA